MSQHAHLSGRVTNVAPQGIVLSSGGQVRAEHGSFPTPYPWPPFGLGLHTDDDVDVVSDELGD